MNTPKKFSSNLPTALVILAAVVYAVYFSWFSILKAGVFDTHSSDLSNMWQTMWNVAHGQGFTFTWSLFGQNVSRLGIHTDYLLGLLSPLTWLWNDANVLLILQAIVVAAGAWFVYRIAFVWLKNPWAAAVAGFSYLLYGPLQFAVLWQFHTDTLAVTFILATAEAIIARRRFWVVALWSVLALISKEHVGILLGPLLLGLYWKSNRRLGLMLLGGAWAYSLVQFILVIPHFHATPTLQFFWNFYYAQLGQTPGQQISHLANPAELWQRLSRPTVISSLVYLLVPLGGLSLFDPTTLLAAVAVAPHWLSDDWSNQVVYYHNHVLAIPFLFLGTIGGWRLIINRVSKKNRLAVERIVMGWATFFAVIGILIVSPNPWGWQFNRAEWLRNPYLAAIPRMKRLIPSNASVSYSKQAGSAFRDRRVAQELPNGADSVDYVVLVDAPDFPGQLPALRTNFSYYEFYLATSKAFVRIYSDGHNFIYRRLHNVQLEPIPAQYGPPSAIGHFITS